MSQTTSPQSPDDTPEDLAGAYVLGVLDGADHADARRRSMLDPDFARDVEAWEERLTPMVQDIESQTLSRDIWPEIRKALPINDNRLVLWRGLTAASGVAAVAAIAAMIMLGRPAPLTQGPKAPVQVATAAPAEPMQVALLMPQKGPTVFVATLDRSRKMMTVSPGAVPHAKGKSMELWMIPPNGAPQALGVIPTDKSAKMPMPDAFAGSGQTPIMLAVTMEPEGGSPTGKPTGPMVAKGAFVAV